MILNLPDNPNSSIHLNLEIGHPKLLNHINKEVDRFIISHGEIVSKLYQVKISNVDITILEKHEDAFLINGIADINVKGRNWVSKLSGNGMIAIKLMAKYTFDSKSLLTLNIEIQDLTWQSPPIFNIGSSHFPLSNIGDKILTLAKNGIQEKINDKTTTKFNISKIINHKINELLPITTLVGGQDINIYLQNLSINITDFHSSPTDMILQTNIHMQPIVIENSMGIEVNNNQLATPFNFLQPPSTNPDRLQLLTIISFRLIETLLLRKLQSEPIEIMSKSIHIHSLKLYYINDQSIKIELSTDSDILKEFSINCTIEMDINHQILRLEKLDLEIKNAGFFAKSLMILEKPILAFVKNKINPILLSSILKKTDQLIIDQTKEKAASLGITLDIQKETTKVSELQLLPEGVKIELLTDLTIGILQK